ncbi:hypothetical protein AVEN_38509-1 [Araneus ventricosus]|uniref:Uncharacterized protein n=1 Tax=Araneus ventricosus TaxID=182803 RepID=A0A4Y2QI43_ARAVE|nr:hypothetical protein AVEN_38509-1 [Araneus ventricosus]
MIRKRTARTPTTEKNVLRSDEGSSSTQLSAVAQRLSLICPNLLLLRFCQQTVVIHTMSSMSRDRSPMGVNIAIWFLQQTAADLNFFCFSVVHG